MQKLKLMRMEAENSWPEIILMGKDISQWEEAIGHTPNVAMLNSVN